MVGVHPNMTAFERDDSLPGTVGDHGEPQVGEVLGAYEVVRPIARGGMATVFAVRDTRDPGGPLRAMKVLLPLTHADEARTRFRREFRALSRLQHPNVLQVFDWGLRGDRPWYTMELIEGHDLREVGEEWAHLSPEDRFLRVQSVLVQAARALAYIHDRGLVHRDITPGNIMVRPDGVVKLMDFGVVKDLGTDMTAVGEVVGTVAYISPEQISGDGLDARADLYSLGAVLYLLLTGKKPFTAHTLQGYLEKHLHETPKAPHLVEPTVPPHLEEICLRLLEKDPSDRYASATHLLNVLGDIAGIDEVETRWPPRAVGRTLVKARLRDAIDDLATDKQGSAILLSGEVGQGKSRLLDMAEAYARRKGLRVARGRCRPHDRPFGAFIGVYRDLSPEQAPPALRATFEGDDDGVVRERYPVISGFRDLILGRAPCVIVIDDLENADPATLELLEYVIRNTLALAQQRVVFVLAEESPSDGETGVSRQIRAAGPVDRFPIGPLDAAEVEELVLSILPNSPASLTLAQRLHEESGGLPAFIADMLRGLLDEGRIVRDGQRYKLQAEAEDLSRSRLPMPASLRQALGDRLAPLSASALEIGRAVAFARRRLELDALVELIPFDEDAVMAGLDELVEAGIVEEQRSETGEQVELSHHRFRDVLLEALDPRERAARHQRLGEILERQHRYKPSLVVEELAYHFEQAGLAPKAYAYLQMTATRHLTRSLFDEALGFLERALVMEATARPLMLLDDADRRLAEVHFERGQALYALGSVTDAEQALRTAESLAKDVRDPRLLSRVAAELGQQLRSRGANAEAERMLRVALQKAQEVGDASLRPLPLYALGAILWTRGDLEEAERLWKDCLATAQKVSDDRATGFGYNGLGLLAICRGDSAEARRLLEQSAELFERLGMLAPLSIARVNLVELYLSTGILRKAMALADRTVEQARETHHPHGIALGFAYRAQVLLDLGRDDEALQNAEDALELVRQLGTTEDEVFTLTTLLRVEVAHHNTEQALARVAELTPLLAQHDSEGIAPQVAALHAQALADVGRREEALRLLDETPDERQWPHVQVRTDLAKAVALRRLHEPDRAKTVLQRALQVAEANGFRFHQLLAHHELALVVADEPTRARHSRVAAALARSLAANLGRDDARRFLQRNWGGVSAS